MKYMHPRPSSIVAALYTARDLNVDVAILHGPSGCSFKHARLLEEDGMLRDLTTGYLGGSSATMLLCMNHLALLDLVGIDELLAIGFDNPLALIGLGPDDIAQGRDVRFDKERKIFYI